MKPGIHKALVALAAVALTVPMAHGQSSIATDLTNRCAWGANVGWINCRPDATYGAVIGEYYCSGYFYAGNLGWIRIGAGTPTNGYRYSNDSDTDFGINHDGLGNLRGLAWSANAGWIKFEDMGAPTVNLLNGNLSGYAWGANIGWISLSNMQGAVRTLWLDSGPDSDADGMPDAWEYFWVGSLGIFTATSQSDSDEVLDKDEYTMGSGPLNSSSFLRIVNMAQAPAPGVMNVTWTTELRRHYYLEYASTISNETVWTSSGPGPQVPSGAVMTRPSAYGSATQQYWRVRPVVPLAQ